LASITSAKPQTSNFYPPTAIRIHQPIHSFNGIAHTPAELLIAPKQYSWTGTGRLH